MNCFLARVVLAIVLASVLVANSAAQTLKVGVLPYADVTVSGQANIGDSLSRLTQAEIVHSTELEGGALQITNGLSPQQLDSEKIFTLGKEQTGERRRGGSGCLSGRRDNKPSCSITRRNREESSDHRHTEIGIRLPKITQGSHKIRGTFFSLLLFPALFPGNPAVAQQSNKPVTPVLQHSEDSSAASQASKGQAPQASPEIQSVIKALSGEWSLSVKWEPDASMPNGMLNTGEENWRAGPGGYTLLEEEHLRTPQGDVFLLGVVWWNSTTKNFQGMECQNLLPYTCDVKGALNDITMSWDGKQFVIDEIETSNTGKKSMWHEVWSDITPSSFTQTGEYGEAGAPRKRLFTIHGTKWHRAANLGLRLYERYHSQALSMSTRARP